MKACSSEDDFKWFCLSLFKSFRMNYLKLSRAFLNGIMQQCVCVVNGESFLYLPRPNRLKMLLRHWFFMSSY